jgi:hypothetical protein
MRKRGQHQRHHENVHSAAKTNSALISSPDGSSGKFSGKSRRAGPSKASSAFRFLGSFRQSGIVGGDALSFIERSIGCPLKLVGIPLGFGGSCVRWIHLQSGFSGFAFREGLTGIRLKPIFATTTRDYSERLFVF